SGLLKVLTRVSTRASVFPTCLTLHDVQFEREPIFDGFLSQIWQGTFQGHTVALKVIKIYRISTLSLWREGILWSHLSHPNVVPFYGIYHLHNMEEQVCLVSPWMNQGNIVDFISRNSRADRVKLMFEVAEGIKYLHDNNVIHGDLKGANVLITEAGKAALCDFGLSTVTLDFDIMAYTSIETIPHGSGTLRYQAPELFAPEDATEPKLTKESDIYSFSCLCYEVFTNKIPFYEIPFEPTVVIQVYSGNRPSRPPPNDPSWNFWGLTEDIWKLIENCWNQIPASR
ncbi:kinase-like domain-containing protein, partial [Cyathus striatus]